MTLLEKTRKINKLLQRSEDVEYEGISQVLSEVLNADIYIANKKGDLYGYALIDEDNFNSADEIICKEKFPSVYVQWFNHFTTTQANPKNSADAKDRPPINGEYFIIVPIYGVGRRIGTLIVARYEAKVIDEDLILAEYGATVVGMKILRDLTEKAESEARKKAIVQIAVATLSYSEVNAAINILRELRGNEGILIASKIADRAKITRSVIVNALRKFQSAGVIDSKSLGMKGTYIKIKNEYLMEEIQKLHR